MEEDGYEMRWVGKRDAYHNAFLPTQKILNPLPDDSKNWDTTGNLLMRGDNIEALRLLRHSYFGAIKLIYIDPPYNTKSDGFIYNDNFSANQTQVLEALGYDADNIDYIKNIYGAKTHSGWLSFMYPRLLLAKELLADEGVIFISIDDNEFAQLKLLCDEVFLEENLVSTVTVKMSHLSGMKMSHRNKKIPKIKEHLLFYAKNKEAITLNDEMIESTWEEALNRYNGFVIKNNASPMDVSTWVRKTVADVAKDNGVDVKNKDAYLKFKIENAGSIIRTATNDSEDFKSLKKVPNFSEVITKTGLRKIAYNGEEVLFASSNVKNGKVFTYVGDIWSDIGINNLHNEGNVEFKNGKKPLKLLQRVISLSTGNDDYILDFFAGSGTTGEAVMRMNLENKESNRKFILVQIPQAIDPKEQKEAYRFITEDLGKPATIFEITAERLRRAGAEIEAKQAAQTEDARPVDTGFRVFDIIEDTHALILQKPLSETTQDDLDLFIEPTNKPSNNSDDLTAKTSQVLYNLLLAEGLPLTTAPLEVIPQKLYLAQNVAIILSAIDLTILKSTLENLKNADTPATYLTVYAPWVQDDNFMQGIKTLAESLGYSSDKLRLRGFGA